MLNWHKRQLEQAFYADVERKERLDVFRKKEDANVAKTAMVRWLLSVVYHVLKERRPYITAYIYWQRTGAAFYFAWRIR